MAENKKAILVYADWKNTFDILTDEEAGKLIKHFFSYVNDENPVCEDRIVQISFEPIKAHLKRDLRKYEGIKEKRVLAGKASAEKRQQVSTNPTHVESVEQTPTNPTVNDNDNVNVNDNVIIKENTTVVPPSFSFKQNLLNYGFYEKLVDDWLLVRKGKKAKNTQTAFDGFIREVEKCIDAGLDKNEVLRICAEKSWQGLTAEWIINKNINTPQNGNFTTKEQQAQAEYNKRYGTKFGSVDTSGGGGY